MKNEFEEKVRATTLFINSISEEELAKFIVNLNNSVDSLNQNNSSLREAYGDLYTKQLTGGLINPDVLINKISKKLKEIQKSPLYPVHMSNSKIQALEWLKEIIKTTQPANEPDPQPNTGAGQSK